MSDPWGGNTQHVEPGCVIGAGAYIGAAYIGPLAMIGDGAHIEDGAIVDAGAIVGAGAVICRKARIGANATVLPGIKVGYGARVGAGSVVTRAVQPLHLVLGNPARFDGFACPQCGEGVWNPATGGPLKDPITCRQCGHLISVARGVALGAEGASR